MFSQAFTRYINNFRGFSREIWILTLITFINRAGTMVLPFLSKYLKEDLHFSYDQVGWILVSFGFGSMAGSWIGGKLSDKIGFYKVMVFSLFSTGILFFGLQFVTSFEGLCFAMFGIMVIADMFRPAMFVSLGAYAKPENRTRALTLVRLAVNLGFAAGPALGGLIIIGIGYKGLFWADGASCIISILIFYILVKEKKKSKEPETFSDEPLKKRYVWNDATFIIFLFTSFTTAMVFFQLFTTLPLYHREAYGLTELHTGLIMSFNGLMVFFMEMPIVGYFERKNFPKIKIIIWGSLLFAASFFVLLINVWIGILLLSVVFLTFGEMFCFPFANSFALSRAPRGQEGKYMALYTMTFSMAHILSAKTGMTIISHEHGGYNVNWFFMGCAALLAAAATLWVKNRLKNETA
ncbi:MFS transporter [Flavobacterium beibuense]|uniref:Major facilitator transporter n=1 Tax=Flavobacterium beibuense TaxID=657326 RepID=A0A444WAF1_9FLAO|nr:MFS transporter [Flavobacterium beibuense]RYJ42860.1 Major facilitator transporter [Flavobacterium beibuense]